MSYKRTDYLFVFEQRFVKDKSEHEMLHDDRYWTQSIPHEKSGPCETYNPPFESDPGHEISIFMVLNSTDIDPDLDIFLHRRNKFFYSKKSTYNTKYLDQQEFKQLKSNTILDLQHPRVIGNLIYP